MRCSIEDCTNESKHTIKMKGTVSLPVTPQSIAEVEVNFCTKHWGMLNGSALSCSVGCSPVKIGSVDKVYDRGHNANLTS